MQVPLGEGGRLCVHASADVGVLFDVSGAFGGAPESAGFVARSPLRIFDTRNAIGIATKAPLASESTVAVAVAGLPGVPSDVRAVTFNATAVDALGTGFVTLSPCGAPRPDTSNLNYDLGATVARHAVVPASSDGAVCVDAYGSSHVLLGLAGTFGAAGGARYRAESPQRILDTRAGSGATGELLPYVTRELWIEESGADAVVLNVTVTGTKEAGWLGAWPCDEAFPDVSNLNFEAGATVANLATLKLGPSRKICFVSSSETDLLVDRLGIYLP
ncbi:MAG: hypothetical protein FJ096_09945 [Deltaproteobacteria bacterium]|nr:hypothetical protein [Deltaproteobacteria bacterium]